MDPSPEEGPGSPLQHCGPSIAPCRGRPRPPAIACRLVAWQGNHGAMAGGSPTITLHLPWLACHSVVVWKVVRTVVLLFSCSAVLLFNLHYYAFIIINYFIIFDKKCRPTFAIPLPVRMPEESKYLTAQDTPDHPRSSKQLTHGDVP